MNQVIKKIKYSDYRDIEGSKKWLDVEPHKYDELIANHEQVSDDFLDIIKQAGLLQNEQVLVDYRCRRSNIVRIEVEKSCDEEKVINCAISLLLKHSEYNVLIIPNDEKLCIGGDFGLLSSEYLYLVFPDKFFER